MVKPVWNNAQRVNHQNFAKKTHPCAKKNLVPRAVLMKSGLVSINIARQNISKIAVLVNTARQVNAAHSKTIVNAARPMSYLSKITHSTVKRPIHKNTTFKNSNINQRVNTVRGKKFNTARPKVVVNAVKRNNFNVVKASACWVWKPKHKVLDHVSKHNSASITLKKFDYVDAQDGGYVAFGGNLKGGKSQENLIDESQVLLRVPRKNNMYSVDLKNIVPKGGLTFLFAKATSDESKLWHKRLGHLNFKTMNKLVNGNLVRGLPSKLFENDQTCVACQKGKQHRASFVTDDYSRFTWVLFLATKDETSGILKSFITGIENLVGKFDGKADEGFFVRYSLNSKAFRVFNSRTRIVDENLHIRFSENTPNIVVSGPDWLFDIDALTRIINYEPIVAGIQSNGFACTKESDNVDPKSSHDGESKPSSDDGKKVDEDPRKEINVVGGETSIELPFDPNMPALEDYSIFDISKDDEDDGAKANMNNLDITIQVNPILTTRIPKDHPLDQLIGDLQSATQTRRMSKNLGKHGFEEPEKVIHALKDPSWIEAMQEELLQLKLQKVWTLVDLPIRKRAIGSKWVFKNKKDEMGIVMRNKARLVYKVKTVSTPMETQKPMLKDEDGEEVDVHGGRLSTRGEQWSDIYYGILNDQDFKLIAWRTAKSASAQGIKDRVAYRTNRGLRDTVIRGEGNFETTARDLQVLCLWASTLMVVGAEVVNRPMSDRKEVIARGDVDVMGKLLEME
ncbi:putative ribonuclease H-like domain-containing protein [Tanacetum coccineum]